MKQFKFIIILLIYNFTMAQQFTTNNEKSKVNFSIKNLGMSVNGNFSGIEGKMILNNTDLKNSSIEVSVQSKTVNTENKARDKHLRKEDYFDVEKFTKISFKSSKIEATKRINRYNVEGNLTLKGISKVVQIEVLITNVESNPELKCNFELNRKNFKIGGNSMVLSDNVKMDLNIVFKK